VILAGLEILDPNKYLDSYLHGVGSHYIDILESSVDLDIGKPALGNWKSG
jgi:hypothetical protein